VGRGSDAQGSSRKEKEDLVDSNIVDYLRKVRLYSLISCLVGGSNDRPFFFL